MRLTFIELPIFTSIFSQIANDENLRKLQSVLLNDAEAGDLIPKLQGLRKIRMALGNKGKSGGARIIYLYLKQDNVILLFYAYTKAKSENLTPDQVRRLQNAVQIIKQEFRHEK